MGVAGASRDVPLDCVPNFRDLGGLRCAGGVTRARTVCRSARITGVTRRDAEALQARLRLRTIIDCRNDAEREPSYWARGDGHDELDRRFPPVSCPVGEPRPPLGAPARLCVPFQAPNSGLIRHGLRELSVLRIALRFVWWEARRRTLAALPFGWLGGQSQWEQRQRTLRSAWLAELLHDTGGYAQLYYMFATTASAQLCWAMEVCATAEAQPCLAHCHSGKDRTGLVSALLLEAVGVSRENVLDDFEASHAFAMGEAAGAQDAPESGLLLAQVPWPLEELRRSPVLNTLMGASFVQNRRFFSRK